MPTPKALKNVNSSDLTIEIRDLLLAGQTVHIPGLGNFKAHTKAARTARNPRTGEAIQVPSRKAVKHSVPDALKTALNPA